MITQTDCNAAQRWTNTEIQRWVDAQQGDDYWYQSIPIRDGIVTPGTVASERRLALLDLPDLAGKRVLDVGCNSGMYAFEAKRRNAAHVVGIDVQPNRLAQARTINEILGFDVEFREMGVLDAEQLDPFDVVFCFAVLTEVTDLIRSLTILKGLTNETLYLELALAGNFGRRASLMGRRIPLARLFECDLDSLLCSRFLRLVMNCPGLRRLRPPHYGKAGLRKIKGGWSLVPDERFLEALLGDKFQIVEAKPSVRYDLLKLVRTE